MASSRFISPSTFTSMVAATMPGVLSGRLLEASSIAPWTMPSMWPWYSRTRSTMARTSEALRKSHVSYSMERPWA